MTGLSCCDVWHFASSRARAEELDRHFPSCQCEPYSLRAEGGPPVADEEVLARIITSPADYDVTAEELLISKLTSVYLGGLSVIRSGASDDEIFKTIDQMLDRQADEQALIGAVIVPVKKIREMENGERWFGIYATDATTKEHHADLAGTFPSGQSNSQLKKIRSQRRYRLRDVMKASLVTARSPDQLLETLRAKGI